ncbi:hypothetical protein AGMMS49579_03730 [Spirochaetia bacterium]|nr:hypothetical protein AGMMS49579_03730 [Spirochaetia bacterium]
MDISRTFDIDNPYLKFGLGNIIFNDNLGPADNIIWSSTKVIGGGGNTPATPTSLGTIQLAGDITGTATNPRIANNVINNNKLANMANPSMLKGSSSTSNATTDITLGNGLTMNGTTLTVDTTTIQKAGTSQFGLIEFNTSQGDLADSGTNSGIAVVKPGAITNTKLANMSGISQLKGSNANSTNVVDLSLGPGLLMNGDTLQVNTNSIQNAGNTQFGIVEFDVTTGDLADSGTNSGIAVVKPKAITTTKMADLSSPSHLLGSSSTSPEVTEITLGNGLNMNGTTLNVDVNTMDVVPVSKGGTGTTSLNGYLIGNGTNPVTSSTTIPISNVSGGVSSVNGIQPNANGNVTVLLSNVTTGTLTNLPTQPQPNGNIYIISNDGTNNGRTFLSTGTTWLEITASFTTTDNRYVIKSGDTMGGNLTVPNGDVITLTDLPTQPTDAVNKAYIDQQISSAVPQATTTIVGTIQLAGVLGGTATSPTLNNNSVTNNMLANLPNPSMLKGSSSSSNSATDISLGQGLTMNGSTLTLDTNNIQKAGNSQFGLVEFNTTTGDLADSGTNSGIAVIKPGAITNAKLTNMSGTSMLKGSNSTSTNVTDLSLGQGLSITNNTLNVSISKAGNTQFGTIEFDPNGDLTDVNGSNANSGIAVVKPGSITTSKLANLPGPSQLLGSSSNSTNPTNINLGNGLQINGNTLSSNVNFISSTDPNIVPPTVAPQLPNTIYIGTDGSIWIWNGTNYIKPLKTKTLYVKQSKTLYTITQANSPALPLNDFSLTVPSGSKVRINYVLNFQSVNGNTYAPSFGFSGVATTDIFQASIIGFFATSTSVSSFSTIYQTNNVYNPSVSTGNPASIFAQPNINADNVLLASNVVGTGYTSLPTAYGDQAIPVHIIAYYQNNGSASTNLIPLFNTDLKTIAFNVQISGGFMDYIFY